MRKVKKVRLCHVFKPGEYDRLKKLVLTGKNPIDYLKNRGFSAQKGPEDPFLPDTLCCGELWIFRRDGMAFCMQKAGEVFAVDSIKAITPAQENGEKP